MFRAGVFLLTALVASAPAGAASSDPLEFFEKQVRPILAGECAMCHNEKAQSAGLDLKTANGYLAARGAGFFGAADNPERSLLLKALGYEQRVKMPPQGRLDAEKIDVIRRWLAQGAPWPGVEQAEAVRPEDSAGKITDADRNFWAFRPLSRQAPPAVAAEQWVRTPVDRFILAKLEANGLAPAPPAGKQTLLRRVTFDLTGLPPSEKEVRAFLADESEEAFDKVVERLLASPRYGERWGRQWLDVARYADSTGSDEDHRYPHAWRYRDYVIRAFNDDLPYDRFVQEQLAGDILAADPAAATGPRGIVATGFLALGKKALAQRDLVLKRYDVIDDQIDVTSKAFLGLTVSCARCHDHKFDPILQRDYYSLASVFASTHSYENGAKGRPVETPLTPPADYKAFTAAWDAILAVDAQIAKILDFDKDAQKYRDKYHADMAEYMIGAYEVHAQGADAAATAAKRGLEPAMLAKWIDYLDDPAAPELAKWREAGEDRATAAAHYAIEFKQAADFYDRNQRWWRNARRRYPRSGKLVGPRPEVRPQDNPFFYKVWLDGGPLHRSADEQMAALDVEKRAKLTELLAKQKELESAAPSAEIPMACAVVEGGPVEQRIFVRGDHHNLGAAVPKAWPAVLTSGEAPAGLSSTSGRLDLARWIVSDRNPLAARVIANRVWGWHFGEALVRTPDNFGKLGEKPTHPELLDYLARSLRENGWSLKSLHRLIVLSNAYRMAGTLDPERVRADPENRLLARFPRRRLTIEEIRDALLAVGGNLDPAMGGTLDPGIGTDGETSPDRISKNPDDFTRRSVYLPLRRANLPNLFTLFDFGDATNPSGKRGSTTVATQALFMMNSPFVMEQARAAAQRLLADRPREGERIEGLYLAALSRFPDGAERDRAMTYLHDLRQKFDDFDESEAWQSLARVLLASNEFIYVR